MTQIKQSDELLWQETARDILANNLCHYKGAYAGALFHAKAVCESEPTNVNAWEIYLDIGANRAKILSTEKVQHICDVLENLQPGNLKAQVYRNSAKP